MSAKDQTPLAASVVRLAEDIGGLVAVVDHSRKNRPDNAPISAADLFGPVQKWMRADHTLILDHEAGDDRRWHVAVEGKDAESARFILTRSAPGSGQEKLTFTSTVEALGNRSKAIGDANRARVLAALRSLNRWASSSEIVAATAKAGPDQGLGQDAVGRHLGALMKAGLVDQAGKGRAARYRALESTAADAAEAVCGDSVAEND